MALCVIRVQTEVDWLLLRVKSHEFRLNYEVLTLLAFLAGNILEKLYFSHFIDELFLSSVALKRFETSVRLIKDEELILILTDFLNQDALTRTGVPFVGFANFKECLAACLPASNSIVLVVC